MDQKEIGDHVVFQAHLDNVYVDMCRNITECLLFAIDDISILFYSCMQNRTPVGTKGDRGPRQVAHKGSPTSSCLRLKGQKGDPGDPGSSGPKGLVGPRGTPGTPGAYGEKGEIGTSTCSHSVNLV